ncbi:MAG TPA: hypothetical protein VGQ99_05065 [Tepidisphaeraceae bacterium]|nr:hypothetical protein [Tepidisphaeraceae bacterium]HEV8604711.1 hypothetical protein [Tepidisphaeraceae bacterium]
MRNGILYNVSGDDRRQLLFDSIASVRRHEPRLPVHVVTDVPLDVPFTWVRGRPGPGRWFYSTQSPRFSPFDLTLFLSSEMQLQRAIDPLESLLADDDLAMRHHPQVRTLGELAAHGRMMRALPPQEQAIMMDLAARNPDAPFFDTRILIFCKSNEALRLFDAWHEEWLKFEGSEQTALARALDRVAARVRLLPDDFGPGPPHPPRAGDKLVHFSQIADRPGELALTPQHKAFVAFRRAVQRGLCSPQQYVALGALIVKMRPVNFLVFGCGADSLLWGTLNIGGRTRFVESNPDYAKAAEDAGLEVVRFDYHSRRGHWAPTALHASPGFMNETAWDIIFVDGPAGFTPEQPGRELPILWAANNPNKPAVVVHDFDRVWERSCCGRYLGKPDFWLHGSDNRPQEMAFWLRGRAEIFEMLD